MPTSATCSACGSTKLMRNVHVRDQVEQVRDLVLTAVVHEHPDALLFKGGHLGRPRATICGDCGLAALYLENPAEFWEVYKKAEAEKGR